MTAFVNEGRFSLGSFNFSQILHQLTKMRNNISGQTTDINALLHLISQQIIH